MIRTAAQEMWTARTNAADVARRRDGAHRRVAAIDEMLDVLEHMHLNRERTINRLIRTRLRHLEDEVGLPVPRKVVRARNTVRLHAALLDWQDIVLDDVVPGRRAILDGDEELEALELVVPAATAEQRTLATRRAVETLPEAIDMLLRQTA